MIKRALFLILTATALTGMISCGGKTVSRVETDTVTDLSGRWNDTDSRPPVEGRELDVEPGTTLTEEGEFGYAMFAVLDGTARRLDGGRTGRAGRGEGGLAEGPVHPERMDRSTGEPM